MYVKYSYTREPSEAEKFIQILSKYPVIALDIEATSLDPFEAKPLLLQISSPYKCYIFDLRYLSYELFRDLLESNQLKLFQNVKYDYKILKQCCGLNLNNVYDTMLAEQLLHLGLYTRASLEYLALKYLNIKMEKAIRSSFIDFRGDFSEKQLEYAARDALVLFDIYNLQYPKLEEYGLVHVSNLEFEFVKPLAHIELNGMKLDSEKWLRISKEYEKRCNEVAEKLANKLGKFVPQQTLFGASPINLDSPDQLLKVLRLMGYNLNNTSKKSLSEYSNDPLIKEILGYREYSKAVTTYGEIFLKNIKDKTGRIHSDFRQLVATGRVSCSSDYGAGLQQIKKDSDFRSCFIAEDGYDIITSDYSQMELRILADYSNDSTFIEAFKHNEDIHAKTASVVFKVPIDLVLKDDDLDDHDPNKVGYRYKAKAINFGLCLSKGTRISTKRGMVPIEDVKIGDIVEHDRGWDKVIDFKFMGKKQVVGLKLSSGHVLEATEDHVLKVINRHGNYTDKAIKALDKSDLICVKIGNNIYAVSGFKLVEKGVRDVYDISVENHPYYLANGVIVHNCYGLTEFGLSSRLGCTKEQARQIIEDYFAGCPGIKKFLEDTAKKAVENKYVESISGRKRFFRLPPKESDEYEFEKNSVERKAKNMPIQGCLEGNTLVRGYGRISSLVGKRLTGLETGFGANSGIGVYSGRRRLYKVTLSNGIELSITDSHKIPVVTNVGELVDKTIFEIDIENDFLMVPISVVKGLCGTITKSAAYEVGFKFRKDVRLPNWVFAEPLETRCIILDCLFESDFKFSSVSYELISNIQQLLLTVGINSYITVDVDGYRVQVYEKFKDRFIQLVRSKDYSNVEFNDFDFCSIKFISDKPIEADAYDVVCDKDPHYYIANGIIVHNSNADIIKRAIIDLDKNLESYDAKIIHTVHDEVVVESNKKDTKEVEYIIDKVLTNAFKKYFHKVPIKTDTVVRPYWSKK